MGDGGGSKSNGEADKGGGRATAMRAVATATVTVTVTTWAMATAMRVAGNKEGEGGKAMVMATRVASNGDGNEQGNSIGNKGGRLGTRKRAMARPARAKSYGGMRIIVKPTTLWIKKKSNTFSTSDPLLMGPWSVGPSGARCASQSSVTAPSDSVSDRSSAGHGQQGRGRRGRGWRCHGGRGPGGRGLGARCVPRSYIVGRTDQKYNEIIRVQYENPASGLALSQQVSIGNHVGIHIW